MHHCILTGFMGTGKTTVGQRVAQSLGCPFYDLDAAIVQAAARDIADIFAHDGEAAFRALERTQLQRLLVAPAGVIATGGGTVLYPQNVERMALAGRIVVLDAPPHVVWARLSEESPRVVRPLLPFPYEFAAIERLWQARMQIYAQFPEHIDTGAQTSTAVAAEIVRRVRKATW